jgi:hypothetical protein
MARAKSKFDGPDRRSVAIGSYIAMIVASDWAGISIDTAAKDSAVEFPCIEDTSLSIFEEMIVFLGHGDRWPRANHLSCLTVHPDMVFGGP